LKNIVDIEEFKRLYAEGMTNKEIANALGCSRDTTRKIRCNLGLLPHTRGPKAVVIDNDELKKLYTKGLNDKEIGTVFGVSDKTIFNRRQSLGLFRMKKWKNTASNIEKLKQLHAEGLNDKMIANVLGMCLDTEHNICQDLELPPHTKDPKAAVIDNDEFKRLYAKGLSDKEIGAVFGVNDKTIFNRRQSQGLYRWKKWKNTAENIGKFKQLHSGGLNDKMIAKVLGICRDTARKIRHDLGLPPQALARKHVDTEKLKNLFAEGHTDKEIGAVFGVSAYTVYERRHDLGLYRRKQQIRFDNINLNVFKSLYAKGMSDKKIGKELCVHHEMITETRHQLGLAPNSGRFHDKKRELYNAGMSDGQIARIIKASKQSVTIWRRSHELPANDPDEAITDAINAKLLKPEEEMIQSDSESLFFDTEFLESLVGKAIKKKTVLSGYTLKKTNTDELKKLFAEGLSDSEIGKLFGVSDRTISNRRRLLGLFRQKPRQIKRKDIDIDELKQLHRAGMSDVEIGKAIDISQSIVFRIRHHLGLASNSGKRYWEMRELYDLGLSDGKIAEILKVRRHSITTWRQSHELPPNDPDDVITDALNANLSKPKEEESIQRDSESLFCDTEFLENYLGKVIKGNM
jgi:DNA-binding CsgD family transcriptional regulator/DNA-binding transcriptional regulator YiaG